MENINEASAFCADGSIKTGATGMPMTGAGAGYGCSGWPAGADPEKLSEAQVERIVILLEECGKAVQACAKTLWHDFHPRAPRGFQDNNPI